MAKNNKLIGKFEIKSNIGLVFRLIWLAFSLFLFFIGYSIYKDGSSDTPITNWLIWGGICVAPIIIPTIKNIIDITKDGAARGSRNYTVTITDTSVSASNNTFMQGFMSLIFGVIFGIAAGPIMLGCYMVITVIAILSYIIILIKKKSQAPKDNK